MGKDGERERKKGMMQIVWGLTHHNNDVDLEKYLALILGWCQAGARGGACMIYAEGEQWRSRPLVRKRTERRDCLDISQKTKLVKNGSS
ncbi:hypothetical protein CDAR_424941 [Caerostris darwini]|uniref:Uncharacterized protein n=1 Tax=Caerostris darwini TaxID=1538125 RepID=A0AAV4V1L6_9ARAC|nr:hypothetical protein CDAR_424941 [Caerostris darwini]